MLTSLIAFVVAIAVVVVLLKVVFAFVNPPPTWQSAAWALAGLGLLLYGLWLAGLWNGFTPVRGR